MFLFSCGKGRVTCLNLFPYICCGLVDHFCLLCGKNPKSNSESVCTYVQGFCMHMCAHTWNSNTILAENLVGGFFSVKFARSEIPPRRGGKIFKQMFEGNLPWQHSPNTSCIKNLSCSGIFVVTLKWRCDLFRNSPLAVPVSSLPETSAVGKAASLLPLLWSQLLSRCLEAEYMSRFSSCL